MIFMTKAAFWTKAQSLVLLLCEAKNSTKEKLYQVLRVSILSLILFFAKFMITCRAKAKKGTNHHCVLGMSWGAFKNCVE